MDDAEKRTFRMLLEEALLTARERVAELEVSSKNQAPDNAVGRLSRMDSFNDSGIKQAALSAAREKLYKLENALENLDDPAFGTCVMCTQPIPMERLLALPESTHCVRCGR
jgi:DnaK suppressor protein